MNATPQLELLLSKLPDAKKNGKGWSARCPAHDDRRPSLSISQGDDGRALVNCFSGCTVDAICAAMGLRVADLMPTDDRLPTKPTKVNGKPPTTYQTAEAAIEALERQHGKRSVHWTYRDANGDPVGVIVRWDKADGKEIRPVALRGDQWVIGGMPEPRPLYCLPDLAGASRVYICEGEKSADAARTIELVTTTSAHGSQSPNKTDWTPLAGKQCVILPDNDEPGDKYADAVGAILAKLTPAPVVKLVELPGLPDHGDIVDWVDAHDAVEAETLRERIEGMADEAEPIRIRAAPRERDRARIECCPIPASKLGDGEQVEWPWHGYLATGFITLLVGLWKGGKTTLVGHLLKCFGSGGDLAGAVVPAKVLVITEEGNGLWARRRDEVGFGDHVYFHVRPFKTRPTFREWETYVNSVAKVVRAGGFNVVIFDTWQAVNPCPDENDAAGTMRAVTPLHGISEEGVAILLVHHPKKGDAGEGQASRGSGALTGFVDIILELRRFNAQEADDRRRKLKSHSRFEETPAEVVIELMDAGYRLVGSTGDANRDDRQQVIVEILNDTDWLTAEGVRDQWPEGAIPKPSKRTIQLDLNHGYDAGRWDRAGAGKRNDPYRYRFAHALEKGTVRETNSPQNTREKQEKQQDPDVSRNTLLCANPEEHSRKTPVCANTDENEESTCKSSIKFDSRTVHPLRENNESNPDDWGEL